MNDAAIALLNSGHAHEAAAGFRRVAALSSEPHDQAVAYFNLGIALKDQARQHDSAAAYLAALRLRPAFPQAHFNLGRSLQMLSEGLSDYPSGAAREKAARGA